jgi:hypothetical protein
VGGVCSANGGKEERVWVIIRKVKGLLGRPRCRWVDNIKTDLAEIEWGGVDWIGPAQDRFSRRALVNTVMNSWVQ